MRFLYTSVPPSTKTKKVCRIVHTFFILSPVPVRRFFQNPGFALRGKTVCPAPEKAGCLSPGIHLFRPPRNKGITHWTLLSPHAAGCMGTPTSKACAKGGPSRPPLETSHILATSFRGPKPEKPSSGSFSPEEKQRFTVPGENGKNDRRIDHANASVKIKRAAHMAQPGKREVAERTAISLYRPFR